jgi:hypothetical protein
MTATCVASAAGNKTKDKEESFNGAKEDKHVKLEAREHDGLRQGKRQKKRWKAQPHKHTQAKHSKQKKSQKQQKQGETSSAAMKRQQGTSGCSQRKKKPHEDTRK